MPPKVSYMGVKVWPADKGEKKKRGGTLLLSVFLWFRPTLIFFCNSSSEEGPASFFLPLIRRALGDDPNYHLVYTVNMHNLLYKAWAIAMAQSVPGVPILLQAFIILFWKSCKCPTVGPGVHTKTLRWGYNIGCKCPTPLRARAINQLGKTWSVTYSRDREKRG